MMEMEVYFPRVFAYMVLAANGIENAEQVQSFSYFRDKETGKVGTFVRDFEFCSFFGEDWLEKRVDERVLWMADPCHNSRSESKI